MIKKVTKMAAVAFSASILLTSCYSHTAIVGAGAQGNTKVTEWNHYVIYGLAPVDVADTKEMAGDAENYTIHTRHTFINGLVSSLTFGLYNPTTTTVIK